MKSFSRLSVNKLIILVVLFASLYSAVMTTIAVLGRGPDAAYVNSAVLLEKYDGFIEARNALEKELKEWQGNVKNFRLEIDSLKLEVEAVTDKKKAADKENKMQVLLEKEGNLKKYLAEMEEKKPLRRKALLQPVRVALNRAVEDYARRKGFSFVFDINEGNIVYFKNAVDITEDVLVWVNRSQSPPQ